MGKGSQPTDQKVTQTSLPEYAEPYVKRLFARAETESKRAYEPYGGERIADFSPTTTGAMNLMRGMGPGITGLNDAMGMTGSAAQQAGQYAQMQPGRFSQYGYGPTAQYGGGDASGIAGLDIAMSQGAFGGGRPDMYNFNDVQQFTPRSASNYMSPYMQNVVDVQKDQAQLDFDRMQAQRDATAVQQGAYGGSRAAVADALAQEDLARRMGEIQAAGQQQAYQDAQGMFEADRAARMQREAERAAEFGRTQGMGMEDYYSTLRNRLAGRELGFNVLGTQAAEQLAREQAQAQELGRVQDAYEQSRQAAAGIGLEGLGVQGALSEQLANMGGMEREAAMDYYTQRMDVGAMEEAKRQHP